MGPLQFYFLGFQNHPSYTKQKEFLKSYELNSQLSLCMDIKNSFGQMTYRWVLWNTYYILLLKKCLWPCPGPSMYLSERIDWIISSFPHKISKIIFVVGSLDDVGSLGCRIRKCPFFHVSILSLGSVYKICYS